MSTYYVPAPCQGTGGQKREPQPRKGMDLAKLPYIPAIRFYH